MALYRPVQTTFWHDVKVLEEMTPEDKLFYLYLLTNPHTKQIGVYPISKKTMAYEIGYSPESINSLLDRFERHHQLIRYNAETRELAIINWGKYNFPRSGTPIENCVNKELTEVKDASLLRLIYPHIANEKIKSLYAEFLDTQGNASQSPSRDASRTPSRGEKEKEKEKEEKKQAHAKREGSEEYISEFAQFWEVYPKKVDKKKSYAAFVKYRNNKDSEQHSIDSIVQAVRKYSTSVKNNEKKFIKNPLTYINGENWNDVLDNMPQQKKQQILNFEEQAASIAQDSFDFSSFLGVDE